MFKNFSRKLNSSQIEVIELCSYFIMKRCCKRKAKEQLSVWTNSKSTYTKNLQMSWPGRQLFLPGTKSFSNTVTADQKVLSQQHIGNIFCVEVFIFFQNLFNLGVILHEAHEIFPSEVFNSCLLHNSPSGFQSLLVSNFLSKQLKQILLHSLLLTKQRKCKKTE